MITATATELWRMSATELAEVIKTKQASSREVIEAHLRRIEAVNPSLNAVVIVMGEDALAAAGAADEAVASGPELRPLHGVPFTVKQNIDVEGTPTTQGIRALADAYPKRDAPVVERLKSAGGIPIGRTNMPGGGMRWHCDSELWGATLNPWDKARTPGASSAGEAAAVATGMSPLGMGNDGLGSLRHPAQCCGITVLKPTLGRIPLASTIEAANVIPIGVQLTNVNGPLARRVVDLRSALEIIAGVTWRVGTPNWRAAHAPTEPVSRRPARVEWERHLPLSTSACMGHASSSRAACRPCQSAGWLRPSRARRQRTLPMPAAAEKRRLADLPQQVPQIPSMSIWIQTSGRRKCESACARFPRRNELGIWRQMQRS